MPSEPSPQLMLFNPDKPERHALPAPLFHGDTLRVETEVLAARPSSSRPTQGVVTFEHRAYDQHGTLACRAARDALMLRRPSP